MEKELAKKISHWIKSNNRVWVFNWILMRANEMSNEDRKVQIGLDPESYDVVDDIDWTMSLPHGFGNPVDDKAFNIIKSIDPVFVCWMGEDSIAQFVGYPKMSNVIYSYRDEHKVRPRSGIAMSISNILVKGEVAGLFIGQCDPCSNISVAIFPLKSWKIAKFFGTPIVMGRKWAEPFPIEDQSEVSDVLKQYGEEVLGIEFND